MKITPFKRCHLPQVARLEAESFEKPWSKAMLEKELTNPLAHYFVAEKDGNIIAYCGMWSIAGEGHITNVAVSRKYRQKGVGSRLICKLIETAKSLRLACMMLEVRKSNTAAICLYRSLGFFIVGSRKNYYGNEDALLMNLTLSN